MCVKPNLEAFVNYHFMRLFTSHEIKCIHHLGQGVGELGDGRMELNGTELMWYVLLLLLVSQEDK